jgi:hypothetical protein
MVGNAAFAADYNSQHTQTNRSYLINNVADVVPALPLAYRDGPLLTEAEIKSIFDKELSLDYKEVAYNGFINLFEKSIGDVSKWFSTNIDKQISKELGSYSLPAYTNDINYSRAGNVIKLIPVNYPVQLKDSTILEDKNRLAELETGPDGLFTDETLYEKGSQFYQHKPYNYYMAVLKKYFPTQYEATEPKFLVDDL